MLGDLVSAAVNWFSGDAQRESNEKIAEQNIALQREFAQNGISWKVADAQKAGVHPAFALGASTTNFAPVSVGDVGSELHSKAGQDIGRAINSTMSKENRDTNYEKAAEKLTLEKGALENEMLRSQIVRLKQTQNPAMPTAVTPPLQNMLGGDAPKGAANDPPKDAPPPEHVGTRAGRTWLHHPDFSDAQKVEDRYGDIGEEVYGTLGALPADVWWNIKNSPFWTGSVQGPVDRYRRRQSGDRFVSKRYRD